MLLIDQNRDIRHLQKAFDIQILKERRAQNDFLEYIKMLYLKIENYVRLRYEISASFSTKNGLRLKC